MFFEKKMEESIMTKSLKNARKSHQTIKDIGQTKCRSNSPLLRIGHSENGYQFCQKGGGQKKRFQYCLNPNYSQKFLFFGGIQGHSGSTINPALQDNVLLPEGFTECIYHVGNGKELRSVVTHGLVPGGVSLKTGRHAEFFTVVNPMDNPEGLGENPCDLSKARIAP